MTPPSQNPEAREAKYLLGDQPLRAQSRAENVSEGRQSITSIGHVSFPVFS